MNFIKLVKEARIKQQQIQLHNEIEILKAYKLATKEIESKIQENIKRGYGVDYFLDLKDELDFMVDFLNKSISRLVKEAMQDICDVNMNVQISFNNFVYPAEVAFYANKSLKINNYNMLHTLISGEYYKDGKSLDSRIWNITSKNKKDIEKLIASNIASGINSRTLAEKLDNYINPFVRTKAKTIVSGMSRNISYQAQRLARTSITQTANETNRQNAENNVFCSGLKWNLSPSHYERQIKRWGPDICDDYATQNGYNLGVGVFPTDAYPVSHPNCLCYSTQVQPSLEDVIHRVSNWVDGSEDKELEAAYQKWKSDS